jgi:hypothetical protein
MRFKFGSFFMCQERRHKEEEQKRKELMHETSVRQLA